MDTMLHLWKDVARSFNDRSAHHFGYYASQESAVDIPDDIALCQKDALAGDERAQRYMAKLLELRMTG